MPFDAIWLVGASDDQWPHGESLNPFVPVSLQRHSGMPYSAPATALNVSSAPSRSVSKFRTCLPVARAQAVTHSSAKSAVLRMVRRKVVGFRHETRGPVGIGDSRRWLETFEDTQGLPLPAGEPAPGGTALIARQSDCPFQAYARHRLSLISLSHLLMVSMRLAGGQFTASSSAFGAS